VDVPQMKYLNIDSNQLRAILPDSLTRFPNLEILDLSYNNIAEVPTGAFRGLEKLMQINLEGVFDTCAHAYRAHPLQATPFRTLHLVRS
jgi:Leucine-rich repeat (LRR) protein